MAFKLASMFVEITAPLSRVKSDLRAAQGSLSASVDRMARSAEVPLIIATDLAPLRKGLGDAKELVKKAMEHVAENHVAGKLAPKLTHATNTAMMAKGVIDANVGRAADVVINVSQGALKAGLSAAAATVRGAVRAMSLGAKVALAVTSVGMNVGFGLAQAYAFKKVKEITGASTVKILLTYAALRVGLAVSTRMVKAATRVMARLAMIPVRVSLAALRAGLRAARSMVASAVRGMASVATVPLRVAAMASPLALLAGGVGVVAGTVAAIGGAVKAASDLNEVGSKLGYAFGDSAKLIFKASDEMAAKFGLVKTEFQEGAAGIGLIGLGAKMTEKDAAQLGVTMARLAADLSSRDNLSYAVSLEKIRAGLVGEAEPLRTVGVLLSETAVQAKALEMGLAQVGKKGGVAKGSITETEKVMARAAIIAEGLRTAQGDLARTSDQLANSARALGGRIKNLAADLGAYLLPAAQSLSAAFGEMAVGLTDAVGRNKGVFEGWGRAIKEVADLVGVVYRNFAEVKAIAGAVWKDLGGSLRGALLPVLRYMNDWAVYFGQLLSRSIEDGVAAAMRTSKAEVAAFGKEAAAGVALALNPLGGLVRHLAVGAAVGGAAGGAEARPPLVAPVFHAPRVDNPEIAAAVGRIKAAEKLNELTGRVLAFGRSAAEVALTVNTARVGALRWRAEQDRATAAAMQGNDKAMAARARRTAAEDAERARRNRGAADAMARGEINARQGMRAASMAGAMTGGGVSGIAGAVTAAATHIRTAGQVFKKDVADAGRKVKIGLTDAEDQVANAMSVFAAAGAGGGVAGGINALALQLSTRKGLKIGPDKEKQNSEFVGLADFAKKIQTGALDSKQDMQKTANGLLREIRDGVRNPRNVKVVAVAGP